MDSFTMHHYLPATIAISSITFLFGLDTGSIGSITTMQTFKTTMGDFSATIHGVIVSSILIPGALTALISGALGTAFGQRRLIALGSMTYAIGAAIEASAFHLGVYILGRLIKGVGQGLFLSNIYVQVSETSPSRIRGITTAVPGFFISLGLVFGFFVCYGTSRLQNSTSLSWRLPLICGAVLAAIFSILPLCVPSSPRWLILHGRNSEARQVIARLGLDEAEQADLMDMARLAPVTARPELSILQNLKHLSRALGLAFSRPFRSRTALACFFMAMQQFSGIDGVLFYAPTLFIQAGLDGERASFLASGGSALTIMATSVIATFLADHWKRRTSGIVGGLLITFLMLLVGSLYAAGQVNSTGPARWVVVASIYIFAAVYTCTWSIGIRTWAVESSPRETRSSASSLAQCTNWCGNYIIALVTPILISKSSSAAYFMFGFASLFCTVIIVLFMFETSGRSLEEIERNYVSEKLVLSRTFLGSKKGVTTASSREMLAMADP